MKQSRLPGKKNRTQVIKPVIMAASFLLLAALSYLFMNANVQKSVSLRAVSIQELTEEMIIAALSEYEATLQSAANDIVLMLERGETEEELLEYLERISLFSFMDGNAYSGTNNFFGYFETIPEGPKMLTGSNWTEPEGYIVKDRPWYRLAMAANGELIATAPQIDENDNTQFHYAKCIFDAQGRRLGIVCMSVLLDSIGQRVVQTSLEQGGYGMLISQEGTILFHPGPDFRGRNIYDPVIPFSSFADEVESGDVYERSMVSYQGERAVGFFKRFENGWNLGLVTPEAQYYQDTYQMALLIALLALAFAVVFVFVMLRLDAARERSDVENRHKSAFLANISHEIRTPINAIVGMTAIGRVADTQERMRYCCDKIDNASRHLLGVINDILDMSKIEANKIELSPTDFLFEKMLQQVLDVVTFRLDEKHQKLTVRADESIPEVLYADDHKLKNVITNLLSNAVKFSPENSSIHLEVSLVGEKDGVCTLQVRVTDSGIGISKAQQAELFQPFQQADASTTRRFGGTGLGLFISKSIVEMMGGRIWVESELDYGAVFTFTVQVKRGDATKVREPAAGPDSEGIDHIFAGRRLLLADDVEINRDIVIAQLEPTEIAIDCAENGAQAVELFLRDPDKYDLILMDLQMPEMDGYDATRSIRAQRIAKAKGIPIIAMTANVFREDIERCLAAGMNAHIGKPIDFEEMLRLLKRWLG